MKKGNYASFSLPAYIFQPVPRFLPLEVHTNTAQSTLTHNGIASQSPIPRLQAEQKEACPSIPT